MAVIPSILTPKTPDLSIPPQRERRKRKRFRDKRPKCPYCLESLGPLEETGFHYQTCPICRHEVPEILQSSPLHRFDKVQRWALIFHELNYIWNWEYYHLKSYKHLTGGGWGDEYSGAKEDFEDMNEAIRVIQGDPQAFLDCAEGPDTKIILSLERCKKGGPLAQDLTRGIPWRKGALELSNREAGPFEITEFQWDYVTAAPWGAYGYEGVTEKKKVLQILEDRMGHQATG